MSIPRILEPEVMDSQKEAVDYDSMDHDQVNRIFVDDMIQFVESEQVGIHPQTWNVVDVGTGTAQIPVALANRWDETLSITAVDLSTEMLLLALKNSEQSSTEELITPVFCDAKHLPIVSQSTDIVMSNSIVHHIPSPADVMTEMVRIVKPGGFLFVRDLLRPDSVEEIEELVQTYAGHENPHQMKMFRDSLHAALTLDEVRQLLRDCNICENCAQMTSDRHWTIAAVVTS